MAVRDYLNGGGKLAHTGETTAYYGALGAALGGIYCGLNGAPDQDCVITDDFFSDCLLLADDFTQYYLGAFNRTRREEPTALEGISPPFGGSTADFDPRHRTRRTEAGTFLPTSVVLPPAQFPQFDSRVSSRYVGGPPSTAETFQGDWFVNGMHADNSYMRLSRTIDLTVIIVQQQPMLDFALAYDTELGYDKVIIEAHTVGQDDWTTLPDIDGITDTGVPTGCEAGFLLEEHPFLVRYLTVGNQAGEPTGTTGSWNRRTGLPLSQWQQLRFPLAAYVGQQVEVVISYVTDFAGGGAGVFIDQTSLELDNQQLEIEGFEAGLGPWTSEAPPPGSPTTGGGFVRSQSPVGASISTQDSVLLGFGVEQISDPAQRAALIKGIVAYLAPSALP
jgi:hypothetical protein